MLAMVWLFPVPGGPSMMKDSPAKASLMALIWEESAGKGKAKSPGLIFSSMSETPTREGFSSHSFFPEMKEAMKGFSNSSWRLVLRSFHITKWAKPKRPAEETFS